MTMELHLNIFVPGDLMEALDAYAAEQGINRSQAARLAIRRYVVLEYDEPYTPPTLPSWQVEAWTALLRGLLGDERLILTGEAKALLVEAVATLNERDVRVLRLRFGLNGPRRTQEETAAAFGWSRERVRQVETLAMRQLRYWLRGSGIWELLGEQLEKGE